jgi:hypothetical protein
MQGSCSCRYHFALPSGQGSKVREGNRSHPYHRQVATPSTLVRSVQHEQGWFLPGGCSFTCDSPTTASSAKPTIFQLDSPCKFIQHATTRVPLSTAPEHCCTLHGHACPLLPCGRLPCLSLPRLLFFASFLLHAELLWLGNAGRHSLTLCPCGI